MPPKTQVNSATGIMGVTGSGKSALGATLAKYVWRKWKKVTLYYASDGGGVPAEVQACVAAGIIRMFRMLTRDPGDLGLAFETCYRATQGWWPKQINPATGDVPPGVEMVPPISVRFEVRCPQGHLVASVPSQALIQPTVCRTCQKPVTKADMQVTKTVAPSKGFEDVGAVFYDGLSSMLAWELRELGQRAGRMELKGEEGAIGGKVTSGDLKFGGITRSHVGFAQTRGEELVHLTLGIPNLVVPPVFTMLTHEDVDDRSLSIIGPKIAGRAKTDEAPQWFGNMMETAKRPAFDGPGEQRVLYLSEFTDDRGVRHLCKHRASPGTMPAYLADPPGGDSTPALAFTQFNLGVFFELLDAALDTRIADVMAEFPDAPGLPDGLVTIGDAHTVQMPKPLQAQAVGAQTLSAPPAAAPAPAAPMAPKAAPAARKKTNGAPAMPAVPAAAPVAPVAAQTVDAAVEAAATVEPVPAAPVPASPAPVAAPTPVPAGVASPAPRVPTTPAPPRPVGAAPPPGNRPQAAAPRPAGTPAPAPMAPAAPRPVAQGTPAGVAVSGPAAPAPRPPAAAPRPPAAAPRPAAPPQATPVKPS